MDFLVSCFARQLTAALAAKGATKRRPEHSSCVALSSPAPLNADVPDIFCKPLAVLDQSDTAFNYKLKPVALEVTNPIPALPVKLCCYPIEPGGFFSNISRKRSRNGATERRRTWRRRRPRATSTWTGTRPTAPPPWKTWRSTSVAGLSKAPTGNDETQLYQSAFFQLVPLVQYLLSCI